MDRHERGYVRWRACALRLCKLPYLFDEPPWARIKFSPSEVCLFCNKTINANNKKLARSSSLNFFVENKSVKTIVLAVLK